MADKAVDGLLLSVWELFQKTGFKALDADLRWEFFLNEANVIRKEYSGTKAETFSRKILLAIQDYYVAKGRKVPKEDASNITVADKKAVFNILLDARNILEGKTDAAAAVRKYIHCCPAVQTLSSGILEETVKYAEAEKREVVSETA